MAQGDTGLQNAVISGNATITGTLTQTGAVTAASTHQATQYKASGSANGFNIKVYGVKMSNTPTTVAATGLSTGDVILGAVYMRFSNGSCQSVSNLTPTSASPPTVTTGITTGSNGMIMIFTTDANKW